MDIMSWALSSSPLSTFMSSEADALGTALNGNSDAFASLAASALNRGATAAQNGDYTTALHEFRRAAAYAPTDPSGYRYMASVYKMKGERDNAIAMYKKALLVDPQNADIKNDLAGTYVEQKNYTEAEALLKDIAKTNVSNAGPLTTLGFIYMETGRYAESDTMFTQAVRMAPTSATASYNLGLLRNKQGRYDEAVTLFQKALSLDSTKAEAHADLAYAYLGLGDTDRAKQQYSALLLMGTDAALSLASQVNQAITTPKISFCDPAQGNFSSLLGVGTKVSALDDSLATPGASKVFKIAFTFNEPMDSTSVGNNLNWTITEGTGGTAGAYNYGANLNPAQQVHVPTVPLSVTYDPYTKTAIVYFRITQNAAGDGLIDPSHLVFTFSGKDAYGRSMDTKGDQYDGHAITPF